MQKIALCFIGSSDIVDQIIKKIKPEIRSNIEYDTIIINHVEESLALESQLLNSYDLLFFAGHLAYENFIHTNFSNENHVDSLPIVIRYDGTSLYKALFELAMKPNGSMESFTPFSIDFLFEKEVKNTLNEIGFTQADFIIAEGKPHFTTAEWANIHEDFYRTGASNYAITCLTSVANELKKRGIPVKRVVPTHSSIENALELLYSKCEVLLKKDVKTAAISVKWQPADRRPKNRYHHHRQILAFQHHIVDFCEEFQASFTFINENQVNIYTKETTTKTMTNDFLSFPLLQTLEKQTGNRIFVGIGLAEEVSTAESHAEKALKYAEAYTQSSTYVVFANGDISGPLQHDHKKPLVFSSSLEDKKLVDIAKKTSLSPTTIQKLLAWQAQSDNDVLTSHQLAGIFDVSLRSASRILKKLEEQQLAKIIGEEQPDGRGRPRKLYKVLLPGYI